jgi:drug/metabolite transporter (DMT)-like permease
MALAAVGFIPMSVAILIQKLQPIFAISVAVIIGKEAIRPRSFFFIALALISGYFVTFPNGVSFTGDGSKEFMAAMYAL